MVVYFGQLKRGGRLDGRQSMIIWLWDQIPHHSLLLTRFVPTSMIIVFEIPGSTGAARTNHAMKDGPIPSKRPISTSAVVKLNLTTSAMNCSLSADGCSLPPSGKTKALSAVASDRKEERYDPFSNFPGRFRSSPRSILGLFGDKRPALLPGRGRMTFRQRASR